jgi:hypothetical protein
VTEGLDVRPDPKEDRGLEGYVLMAVLARVLSEDVDERKAPGDGALSDFEEKAVLEVSVDVRPIDFCEFPDSPDLKTEDCVGEPVILDEWRCDEDRISVVEE